MSSACDIVFPLERASRQPLVVGPGDNYLLAARREPASRDITELGNTGPDNSPALRGIAVSSASERVATAGKVVLVPPSAGPQPDTGGLQDVEHSGSYHQKTPLSLGHLDLAPPAQSLIHEATLSPWEPSATAGFRSGE